MGGDALLELELLADKRKPGVTCYLGESGAESLIRTSILLCKLGHSAGPWVSENYSTSEVYLSSEEQSKLHSTRKPPVGTAVNVRRAPMLPARKSIIERPMPTLREEVSTSPTPSSSMTRWILTSE